MLSVGCKFLLYSVLDGAVRRGTDIVIPRLAHLLLLLPTAHCLLVLLPPLPVPVLVVSLLTPSTRRRSHRTAPHRTTATCQSSAAVCRTATHRAASLHFTCARAGSGRLLPTRPEVSSPAAGGIPSGPKERRHADTRTTRGRDRRMRHRHRRRRRRRRREERRS